MQTPLAASWADAEDGLSLIELMFAIFLLAVSILALAGIATSSIASVRVARDQQQASDLASAEVEAARGIDFDLLAVDSATAPSPFVAPAPYSAEAPLSASGAPLAHSETVTQGSQTFSVLRWVTQAVNHSGTEQNPIKRLIVHVSWDDRGRTRQVTDSTIVADADRGLPVPRFDLEPSAATVNFPPGAKDFGAKSCTTYTVTNLGLTDSYSWRLVNPQDSSAVSTSVASDGIYHDSSRKWKVRAWFQPTDADDPDLEDGNKMWDSRTESGKKWMESTVRLESRRSAWFTVCFWTEETGGATISNEQQYSVILRSQFDESVQATATAAVTVVQPRLDLFLHELTVNHTGSWNGADHKRTKGSTTYPIMFMDTQPALDDLLHDMDSDHDPSRVHGIRIDPAVPASAAVWDFSVTETQQMATIAVSIHARASAAGAALSFKLERRSSTGAPLGEYAITPVTGSSTVVPTTFAAVTLNGTFDPVASISAGDVLRLTVGCVSTGPACHVDFDTAGRQGTLAVRP